MYVMLLCMISLGAGGPPAVAAEAPAKQPPVQVLVDPRVELISIIFRLAGNPEYCQGRVESYTSDVEKQFGSFRNHPAVELARKLRRTRGVSFDACMSMAAHLADAGTLEEKVPFDPRPEGLDDRWPIDAAREFLEALRKFVKDASFAEFVEKHRPLYQQAESRMRAVLEKDGHLEWFAEFFGEQPGVSFTVALGMLNGGNSYGANCRTQGGKQELLCVLGVWNTDAQGTPQFNRWMLDTVVHEFCHSYTNPWVDRHQAELKAAGQKMFPYVAAKMKSMAYGNWKTMMYESLVRACEVRYMRRYHGALAGWLAVQSEKARGFLWIGELSNLLGEYELHREQYATLDAFSPRIIAFFNEYAETFANQQAALAAKKRPDQGPAPGSK